MPQQDTRKLPLPQAIEEAIGLHRQGRLAEAETMYRAIIAAQPDHFDALHLLGVMRAQQKKFDEAADLIVAALRANPRASEAHFHLGAALAAQNRHDAAVTSFKNALAIRPDYADAHNNLGVSLEALHRYDEAIASYRAALAVKPDHADAHSNLGNMLQALHRYDEAIASYRRALAIKPDHADACNNIGNTLQALGRHEEAIASYRQALAIRPDYANAHNNLGNALSVLHRYGEAIASYREVLRLDPLHVNAINILPGLLRRTCDWRQIKKIERAVIDHVEADRAPISPFVFLNIADDPAIQLKCAAQYARRQAPGRSPAAVGGGTYAHDKIRLAYVSADFRSHATASLMAGLFERHDRNSFEIYGVSFGPDDASAMRKRLVQAFDRFIDVRDASTLDIVRQLRACEIDIAVDLKGFTYDNRLEIFLHRPAPIQVNYLGFPGTTGTDRIDYIIVDRFVAPIEHQPFYAEKLVHLPGCYQVNDNQRRIAERTPSRAECGLPPEGFVFCCFNNSYKITPEFFDIWMRLLQAVPGAVLWLLGDNQWAAENLRREARARGVDANRLVFAPRLKLAEHLARHRLAHLFLDTLPVNAHTTASDALWAGLPVLTCAGNAFAARVAGSLLHAVGLAELVTHSPEQYEALALRLATDTHVLQGLRNRLAQNRLSSPLFDTDRFRRHIEAAYTTMWEIWRHGENPRAFAVAPIAD